MKRLTGILLCLLVFTSCSPSEGAIQTAILRTQTALPTATFIPTRPLVFTKTNIPTLPPTVTVISSLTPTLTPVPQSSILFQKTFEDGAVGKWSTKQGTWTIGKEPDGNRYLAGSGFAQIQYTFQKTPSTDFAIEFRLKFIKGYALHIWIHSDDEPDEHYGVAFNYFCSIGGCFSIIRGWSQTGSHTQLASTPDRWYTIKMEIKGDRLSAYVDNEVFLAETLRPLLIGHNGIEFVMDGEVYFDDIKVWSLK